MKKSYLNILIILLIIFVLILIVKFLKLTGFCCAFISILSPLFFGYVISWVIKPIVDKFKINRVFITLIIYMVFFCLILIVIINIIPLIIEECKKIYPVIKYYINHNVILYKLYESLNIKKIMSNGFSYFNNCVNNIFDIFINFIYSLIFGFYFLISKKHGTYFKFIPNKLKKKINKDLRLYVKSVFLDTLFMFITMFISFCLLGVPSPFIFALFCAVTNIIPYIGPYIGGIPAILIGFTKSFKFGIIVGIVIMIIQLVENVIVQPFIISKNVHLNPIYILIGLIIFSHYFGIFGMIISTPIILVLRDIFIYYKKNKPDRFNLILDK